MSSHRWTLSRPDEVSDFRDLGPRRPLPTIVELPDRRQECIYQDDALVTLPAEILTVDAYHLLGILPRRELRLRAGVVTRLLTANRSLPDGFGLVVLDAYRTVAHQTALIDHYTSVATIGIHVASIGNESMRAPHTTGGAVDLTLSYGGIPLAIGTGFDDFTDLARLHAFESLSAPARPLRRILAEVLVDQGFAPYEPEWWHWSYGDDVWAARNQRPALYGILEEESPAT